jgi:glycosyltransferase involved in cell wall biosynthesis
VTGGRPSASVIICAYTQLRWDDLQAAVTSVERQSIQSEIIVVIDHEPSLLRRALDAWPQHIVIANEQRQGLSGARNTGMDHSTGEVLFFLDDDASAATDTWLELLLEPYSDASVVGVGGSAQPVWPHGTAPATLPPELLWVVGCTYEGQPTTQADVRNLMGCNMSFRREAILGVGGFNPDMGRVGTLPLGCEETEACIRMSAATPGARIVFEPVARVNHRVTENRLTWGYVLRRGYSEGISKAALSKMLGRKSSLETESAYTRTVLPKGVARELGRGHFSSAAAIVLTFVVVAAGYARGTVRRTVDANAADSARQLEGSPS